MKNILAATLMIIGAIFISAYAICIAIFDVNSYSYSLRDSWAVLLIVGIIATIAGAVLFLKESKKKH